MTALLEAVGITKEYDGMAVLTDVSIEVDAAELVALIGPNGAGKTTLFDCLSGVQRADAGVVHLDGRDLDGLAPYERARMGMARTFQRIELFTGMTVRDHLLVADRALHRSGGLLRDLTGRAKPDAAEIDRCDEVLDLVGLTDDADRPAHALSLGRGRVVELARALMCQPRLLFLDEPSSGLDRSETADMAGVLERVMARGETAILLCEHDVPFVERLASRTYVLDCGKRIAAGPTREVLADPHVRAAYLGQGV